MSQRPTDMEGPIYNLSILLNKRRYAKAPLATADRLSHQILHIYLYTLKTLHLFFVQIVIIFHNYLRCTSHSSHYIVHMVRLLTDFLKINRRSTTVDEGRVSHCSCYKLQPIQY